MSTSYHDKVYELPGAQPGGDLPPRNFQNIA